MSTDKITRLEAENTELRACVKAYRKSLIDHAKHVDGNLVSITLAAPAPIQSAELGELKRLAEGALHGTGPDSAIDFAYSKFNEAANPAVILRLLDALAAPAAVPAQASSSVCTSACRGDCDGCRNWYKRTVAQQEQAKPTDLQAAARDVLAERQRQVEQEGWTPERDDGYTNCELARAAATYAVCSHVDQLMLVGSRAWPWREDWFKHTTYRRDLTKSGALILAEIERLDRAATPEQKG